MNGSSARSGGAALDATGVSVMGPETRLQQSFPSASQACAIVGETLPPKTSKPRAAVDGGVVLVADKLAASPQPAQRQESATNNNNNGKSRPASPQRQQSTVEQQQSETTATADSAADAMVLRGGQRILRKSSS
jgi:hypothetical protein